MTRNLVFVPLIGSQPVEDYSTVPHIKVWGLWDGEQLETLYMENAGAEQIGVPANGLFEAERKHIQAIDDGDTTVPDVVYQRLAADTLLPVREG